MIRDIDILIIGAGPAGLSAAIAAGGHGDPTVVVIDRLDAPGGLLPQCIHSGFGARRYGREMTGPEYARLLTGECRMSGADINCGSFADGIVMDSDGRFETLVRDKKSRCETITYRSRALVLATGCRERTIGQLNGGVLTGISGAPDKAPASCELPLITGTRPSGIFTAGSAQRMINLGGYRMGKRALILGSGDIGLIMARRLTLSGTEVAAIVEREAVCGGMARNKKQCADAYDIPFIYSSTITRIYGGARIEGVEISGLHPSGMIAQDRKTDMACDTLLLSVGLIPEIDLIAGICAKAPPHITEADIPPGLFVCGNAREIRHMADDIADDGSRAGLDAAMALYQTFP